MTMTITESPTLDQVLSLAHKLSLAHRAELIARLSRELAVAVAEPPRPRVGDPWEQWAALRAELSVLPRSSSLADQLEADRRERQESLAGSNI